MTPSTPPKTISHTPVMLNEVIAALNPQDGAIYVDGTFGGGGYSKGILDAANCQVIGIDRDPAAVARGAEIAKSYDGRLEVLHGQFGDMADLVRSRTPQVDGVALDLGVSSYQIDDPERGFSFRFDGPLDMRMDTSSTGETAADVVNTYPQEDLANIIYEYGEERYSRRIASRIVTERTESQIISTKHLVEIVRSVVPKSKDGIDPATRTFQALRIYVNRELHELDRGLCGAEELLTPGGKLAVVSFHSLEDRRVKNFLKTRAGKNPKGSKYLPEVAEHGPAASFALPSAKGVAPTDEECRDNPRARSARMRVGVRTEAPAWDTNEGTQSNLGGES